MDEKRKVTKQLLAESFRELVLAQPFDKITIKMITDSAGVIRPTFYNYFQDKYDVLEWYFRENVLERVRELLENDMEIEGLKMLLILMDKDRDFYKRALTVKGQNSFRDILQSCIYELFLGVLNRHKMKNYNDSALLTKERIASFYSLGFVYSLEIWIQKEQEASPEDMLELYMFFVSHSIWDILER